MRRFTGEWEVPDRLVHAMLTRLSGYAPTLDLLMFQRLAA